MLTIDRSSNFTYVFKLTTSGYTEIPPIKLEVYNLYSGTSKKTKVHGMKLSELRIGRVYCWNKYQSYTGYTTISELNKKGIKIIC